MWANLACANNRDKVGDQLVYAAERLGSSTEQKARNMKKRINHIVNRQLLQTFAKTTM